MSNDKDDLILPTASREMSRILQPMFDSNNSSAITDLLLYVMDLSDYFGHDFAAELDHAVEIYNSHGRREPPSIARH